jgi:hypothetical protein
MSVSPSVLASSDLGRRYGVVVDNVNVNVFE